MSYITDLKDSLVRKLSSSFLLRYLDGYKTTIGRVVQGVNLIVTGSYLIAAVVDQYKGSHLVTALDAVNAQWALLTSWLAGQGFYELGKADQKAKENLGL